MLLQLQNQTLFLGLQAVLLHIENQLPSVPIAYGNRMKETYESMEKILQFVKLFHASTDARTCLQLQKN